MKGMLNMTDTDERTPAAAAAPSGTVVPLRPTAPDDASREKRGPVQWIRSLLRRSQSDEKLREAIEEFIGDAGSIEDAAAITWHERSLISNVLHFRDLTVVDVMIPRADITAIDINTSQKDLLALLSSKQFSRLPVYRNALDDIVGTLHIKDILATLAQGKPVRVADLVREVPVVSPSMPALDLILMMKQVRKHMALVVDEYGGIDGLVTIGDVIEAVFGEVEDEHAADTGEPELEKTDDNTWTAEGRVDVEQLERECGRFLTDDERADVDTIGGLIFYLAGRVPGRGEVITHPSGISFEILDADPRRVNRVLVTVPLINTASQD